MLNLKGEKIAIDLPREVHHSLIYYDMDILYISKDDKGELFAVLALDSDDGLHIDKWLMTQTTSEMVQKIENHEITTRDLIKSPTVYVLDVDYTTGHTLQVLEVLWEDMPEDYLPTVDSYLA